MKRINTKLRGPGLFGPLAMRLFRKTMPGHPLFLMREPANPADTNAIICCDVDGISIGYVARTAAAVVAPDMDRGLHWRGKITGRPSRVTKSVTITLWRDEPGSMQEIFRYQKELVQ
jgi:HIRAN domain